MTGTTSPDGQIEHTHDYKVDENGHGVTIGVSNGPDHAHKIVSNTVLPAGMDEHGHTL